MLERMPRGLPHRTIKIVAHNGFAGTRTDRLNTIQGLPGRREPRIGGGVSWVCLHPASESSRIRGTRIVPIQSCEPFARFNFRLVTVHRIASSWTKPLSLRSV